MMLEALKRKVVLTLEGYFPDLRRSEVGLINFDNKTWMKKKKGRQQGQIYSSSQWGILAAEVMQESRVLPVVPLYSI